MKQSYRKPMMYVEHLNEAEILTDLITGSGGVTGTWDDLIQNESES